MDGVPSYFLSMEKNNEEDCTYRNHAEDIENSVKHNEPEQDQHRNKDLSSMSNSSTEPLAMLIMRVGP